MHFCSHTIFALCLLIHSIRGTPISQTDYIVKYYRGTLSSDSKKHTMGSEVIRYTNFTSILDKFTVEELNRFLTDTTSILAFDFIVEHLNIEQFRKVFSGEYDYHHPRLEPFANGIILLQANKFAKDDNKSSFVCDTDKERMDIYAPLLSNLPPSLAHVLNTSECKSKFLNTSLHYKFKEQRLYAFVHKLIAITYYDSIKYRSSLGVWTKENIDLLGQMIIYLSPALFENLKRKDTIQHLAKFLPSLPRESCFRFVDSMVSHSKIRKNRGFLLDLKDKISYLEFEYILKHYEDFDNDVVNQGLHEFVDPSMKQSIPLYILIFHRSNKKLKQSNYMKLKFICYIDEQYIKDLPFGSFHLDSKNHKCLSGYRIYIVANAFLKFSRGLPIMVNDLRKLKKIVLGIPLKNIIENKQKNSLNYISNSTATFLPRILVLALKQSANITMDMYKMLQNPLLFQSLSYNEMKLIDNLEGIPVLRFSHWQKLLLLENNHTFSMSILFTHEDPKDIGYQYGYYNISRVAEIMSEEEIAQASVKLHKICKHFMEELVKKSKLLNMSIEKDFLAIHTFHGLVLAEFDFEDFNHQQYCMDFIGKIGSLPRTVITLTKREAFVNAYIDKCKKSMQLDQYDFAILGNLTCDINGTVLWSTSNETIKYVLPYFKNCFLSGFQVSALKNKLGDARSWSKFWFVDLESTVCDILTKDELNESASYTNSLVLSQVLSSVRIPNYLTRENYNENLKQEHNCKNEIYRIWRKIVNKTSWERKSGTLTCADIQSIGAGGKYVPVHSIKSLFVDEYKRCLEYFGDNTFWTWQQQIAMLERHFNISKRSKISDDITLIKLKHLLPSLNSLGLQIEINFTDLITLHQISSVNFSSEMKHRLYVYANQSFNFKKITREKILALGEIMCVLSKEILEDLTDDELYNIVNDLSSLKTCTLEEFTKIFNVLDRRLDITSPSMVACMGNLFSGVSENFSFTKRNVYEIVPFALDKMSENARFKIKRDFKNDLSTPQLLAIEMRFERYIWEQLR